MPKRGKIRPRGAHAPKRGSPVREPGQNLTRGELRPRGALNICSINVFSMNGQLTNGYQNNHFDVMRKDVETSRAESNKLKI